MIRTLWYAAGKYRPELLMAAFLFGVGYVLIILLAGFGQ